MAEDVKKGMNPFGKGLITGLSIMGGASLVMLYSLTDKFAYRNYIPISNVGFSFAEPSKLEARAEDLDGDGVNEFYLKYGGRKYMIMKAGDFSEFDANGPVREDIKVYLKEFSVEPGKTINPRIKYLEEKK